MANKFRHLRTVIKHRHGVISNGFKLGIGFHCLKHDLSKFSIEEFKLSSDFYKGYMSPVYSEREFHNYFSYIARHHTTRNKHHWEYWVDIFIGHIVIKTMPYLYCMEYVADVLSAAKTYNPKDYSRDKPLTYLEERIHRYLMTDATKEFLLWCFKEYKDKDFKGLKKEITKKKYEEIISKYPDVEIRKIKFVEPEIVPGEHD